MEYNEDAMSDYNPSQTDWNQKSGYDHDLSANMAEYGEELWDEDYSSPEGEEEPHDKEMEPKPPDNIQHTSIYKELYEEEELYIEEMESNRFKGYLRTPWCEIPHSEHGDYQPIKRAEKYNSYGVIPHKVQASSRPISPKKQVKKGSRSLIFSGTSKDPEVYLQWEENMEKWLQSNKVPKKNKLAQIISAFTNKAYEWWLKESAPTTYKKPILDWEDLKSRMHKEFVEKLQDTPRKMKSTSNSKSAYKSKSKELFTSTHPKKADDKKTSQARKEQLDPTTTFIVPPRLQEWWKSFKEEYNIKDKKIEQGPSTKKPHEEVNVSSFRTLPNQTAAPPQVKCSHSNKFKDLTCYKCHKRGHYAATCPSKKLLGEKGELSTTSDGLINSDLLSSNSSIMHLSLSKGIDTGLEEMDKEERLQAIAIPIKQRPEQDHMKIKEDSDHTHCCDLQVNKKQEIVSSPKTEKVQVQLFPSVYDVPMTGIIHLAFPKGVEIDAGHKVDELRKLMPLPCKEPLSKLVEMRPPKLEPPDKELQSLDKTNEEMNQRKGKEEDTHAIALSEKIKDPEIGVVQVVTTTIPSDADQNIKGEGGIKEKPPDQAKSSIPLNLSTIICYRCQGVGHIAELCPTRRIEHDTSLGLNKDSDNSVDTNLTTSNASILHLSLSKRFDTGLEEKEKEEKVHANDISEQLKNQELKESFKENPPNQVKNAESDSQVSISLTQFVSHDATAVLKSLLDIQEHEKAICLEPPIEEGIAETSAKDLNSLSLSYHKEPMMHLFLVQSVEIIPGIKEVKRKGVTPDHRRGVILSYLLKGEPPDAPHITKPPQYRGKTLNSQRRMKANLLSLGADYIVSRSKPFQEREYDEDIKSRSTKEYGDSTKRLTKTFKRHVRELYSFPYSRFCPNGFSERGFNEATPLMCMKGKACDQSLIIHKPTRPLKNVLTENLGDSQSWRMKDICVFPGAYLPNQEDLSYESNCSRNLTHQGITGKKNWFKSLPHEKDIQLARQRISNERKGSKRVLIEEFQPNQDEPNCKPTCFGNSIHQRPTSNWIHTNIYYGLKVIQLLIQEKATFTLGAQTLQRLVSLCSCELDHLYDNQNVPEKLTYLPKFSRYKEPTVILKARHH